MQASFIHIADTHLGYEQYGIRERFNDFSRAFWQITDVAIERNVDFLLIAGDLFNKRAIDARTLIHAIKGLGQLKEKGIPVIGIEGNHDRSYYRDGASWLQFLCYQGYIQLLAPIMHEGVPQITPWEPERMLGSHIDLLNGHLRIYGLPWQGAATARTLEGMAKALKESQSAEDAQGIEYRLLMMHTGVDGIVPRVQGLPTMAQFQPLREYIDYLALGHVHKPYEFDGWMYNPGSPETCSAEEAQWEKRGYYYVEIDTDRPERIIDKEKKERRHHAQHLSNQRRPFVRYDLRVEALADPEAVYQRLTHYCQREGTQYKEEQSSPIVQIHLTGTLSFDISALDLGRMEAMVREAFQPLYVRVDNYTNDQEYTPNEGDLDGRDRSVWHELERHIFEDLVGLDARYLPAKEKWGTVLSQIKQMALHKDFPEEITRYLREKREELLKI
jgi:DNA repair exonuclease SbcCD nuclease subunit